MKKDYGIRLSQQVPSPGGEGQGEGERLGGLILLIGTVSLLGVAFRDSFFWGVACVLVPIVALFYVVQNWQETKTPFLIQVAGGLLLGGGLYWASLH